MIFNQKGSTILQVLVLLSTIAGVGYYIIDQQNTQSKKHSKNSDLQSFESAAQIIKTALADGAICTHNLKNRGLNYELNSLVNPNGTVIASKNQTYPNLGNIRIQSMKIISWKDPITEEVANYLNVIYELDPQSKKKQVGGKTVSKKLRLRGKIVSGNYVTCYHEESNFIETASIKSCQNLNGIWNNWDCVIDVNQLIDTTATKCNSGKLVLTVPNKRIKVGCL